MWIQFILKYKTQIVIGLAVVFLALYIASLKSEIGNLKGIVADYKIEMSKANADIDRLSSINSSNTVEISEMQKDYNSKLEICNQNSSIFKEKEASLLQLIEALKNRKPPIVTKTVYELQECVVRVEENNSSIPIEESNPILNLLNEIGNE